MILGFIEAIIIAAGAAVVGFLVWMVNTTFTNNKRLDRIEKEMGRRDEQWDKLLEHTAYTRAKVEDLVEDVRRLQDHLHK